MVLILVLFAKMNLSRGTISEYENIGKLMHHLISVKLNNSILNKGVDWITIRLISVLNTLGFNVMFEQKLLNKEYYNKVYVCG